MTHQCPAIVPPQACGLASHASAPVLPPPPPFLPRSHIRPAPSMFEDYRSPLQLAPHNPCMQWATKA